MNKKVKQITGAGVIAAAYIILTLPMASISFGAVQLRLAEVMTVLPFFSPTAVYGLTIGCFVSNILFSSPLDAVVGALATMCAGLLTAKSRNMWVGSIYPVVINAVAVGTMLCYLNGNTKPIVLLTTVGSIFVSQLVSCTMLGVPFGKLLQKYKLDEKLK